MGRVLGGVAAGAVLAGLANVLLFGSLFATGPAESRLLFLAALCIAAAISIVTLVALRHPHDDRLAVAARRRLASPASGQGATRASSIG